MDMKKTSLLLDESLYQAAEKEAQKRNTSVGRVVSEWAKLGRKASIKAEVKTRNYSTVNLGSPSLVSLDSRADWMDLLDG